jgi:hypothetical protein
VKKVFEDITSTLKSLAVQNEEMKEVLKASKAATDSRRPVEVSELKMQLNELAGEVRQVKNSLQDAKNFTTPYLRPFP